MLKKHDRPVKDNTIGIKVTSDFFDAFQYYSDRIEVPKGQIIRGAIKKLLVEIESDNKLNLLNIVEESRIYEKKENCRYITFRCGGQLKYDLQCLCRDIMCNKDFNSRVGSVQNCILRYAIKNSII